MDQETQSIGEMETKHVILFFFDLDGVLHNEINNKETAYPGVIERLKELHSTGDYLFLVASFNNRAHRILEKWGIANLFLGVRSRANHGWHKKPRAKYTDAFFGQHVTKASQIASLTNIEIANHIKEIQDKNVIVGSVHFFDDVQENLHDVNISFPGIECILVDPTQGVLSHLPPINQPPALIYFFLKNTMTTLLDKKTAQLTLTLTQL